MKNFIKNIQIIPSKKNNTIELTSKEAKFLLTLIQYALLDMDNENIEYLYDEYSNDEIMKLGQKIGLLI